jgi:hypothetical protein
MTPLALRRRAVLTAATSIALPPMTAHANAHANA